MTFARTARRQVVRSGCCWQVVHRYSDWRSLDARLARLVHGRPSLPGRLPFGSRATSVVSYRQWSLNKYLQALLAATADLPVARTLLISFLSRSHMHWQYDAERLGVGTRDTGAVDIRDASSGSTANSAGKRPCGCPSPTPAPAVAPLSAQSLRRPHLRARRSRRRPWTDRERDRRLPCPRAERAGRRRRREALELATAASQHARRRRHRASRRLYLLASIAARAAASDARSPPRTGGRARAGEPCAHRVRLVLQSRAAGLHFVHILVVTGQCRRHGCAYIHGDSTVRFRPPAPGLDTRAGYCRNSYKEQAHAGLASLRSPVTCSVAACSCTRRAVEARTVCGCTRPAGLPTATLYLRYLLTVLVLRRHSHRHSRRIFQKIVYCDSTVVQDF